METKWPPDPATVFEELSEPLSLLYDALAYGADEAVKYHEARRRANVNSWLYAHIARDNAIDYLLNAGIESMGFELKKLAMSGIWLEGRAGIRVLKLGQHLNKSTGRFDPGIPPPGHSWARREYFYQPGLPAELIEEPQRLKLVALWDHDDAYQLGSLDLACPKAWNTTSNCVDTHWLLPVGLASTQAETAAASRRSLLDDLPLQTRTIETQAAQ